jgi:hypothetical protein
MTKPPTRQQDAITVKWIDSGLEPQCRPDPRYPDGMDVDATVPGERACRVALPYPAKRIGYHLVACKACGTRIRITTAGRPDDPRSVKVPCSGSGERTAH